MAAINPQQLSAPKYVPPQHRRAWSAPTLGASASSRATTSTSWRRPSYTPPPTTPPTTPPQGGVLRKHRSWPQVGPKRPCNTSLAIGDIVYIPSARSHTGNWLIRPANTNLNHLPFSHSAMVCAVLPNGRIQLQCITSFGGTTLHQKYPQRHTQRERARFYAIAHPDNVDGRFDHPDDAPELVLADPMDLRKPSYLNVSDVVECDSACLEWHCNNGSRVGMRVLADSLDRMEQHRCLRALV